MLSSSTHLTILKVLLFAVGSLAGLLNFGLQKASLCQVSACRTKRFYIDQLFCSCLRLSVSGMLSHRAVWCCTCIRCVAVAHRDMWHWVPTSHVVGTQTFPPALTERGNEQIRWHDDISKACSSQASSREQEQCSLADLPMSLGQLVMFASRDQKSQVEGRRWCQKHRGSIKAEVKLERQRDVRDFCDQWFCSIWQKKPWLWRGCVR